MQLLPPWNLMYRKCKIFKYGDTFLPKTLHHISIICYTFYSSNMWNQSRYCNEISTKYQEYTYSAGLVCIGFFFLSFTHKIHQSAQMFLFMHEVDIWTKIVKLGVSGSWKLISECFGRFFLSNRQYKTFTGSMVSNCCITIDW